MSTNGHIALSLSMTHDSGAAIFRNNELVAAIGEERLNRQKNTRDFPSRSIKAVLDLANASPEHVSTVYVPSQITPNLISLLLPEYHSSEAENIFSPLLRAVIAEQVMFRRTGLIRLERAVIKRFIANRLAKLGVTAPVVMCDHHESHAWTAYLAADFDDSLVVTVDGMGDGLSSTCWVGLNGALRKIDEMSGFHTPSHLYSMITQLFGFKPLRHEGKITGLAAYGDPTVCRDLIGRLLRFENGIFHPTLTSNPKHPLLAELMIHDRADIAAALQAVFEDVVVAYVTQMLLTTGKRNVCLAGGVFANVKLNQRIHEIPGVENIFVFPNMGDGGLPVGPGYKYSGKAPGKRFNAYLGPGYNERQIAEALRAEELKFDHHENAEAEIARLLWQDKVVARFNGRMEYGPRALGNRSILYRPDDPSINDRLNRKLRRTEFMPFAPATADNDADRYYVGLEGARSAARYMTITFDCTTEGKERMSGCVHVDGTARPQLVGQQDNPSFHEILTQYGRLSGAPAVVNTSFNAHEEPIVNTPQEAIGSFLNCGLDVLAIGEFIVHNPRL